MSRQVPDPDRSSHDRSGAPDTHGESDSDGEWERRHAETKADDRDGGVVSADPPADEWAKRHGHCPRDQ